MQLSLFDPLPVELGPLGLRPKRGRPVAPDEIRQLYRKFGDIKRVALELKIHERRVRPLVRDLMTEVRELHWARRRRSVRTHDATRLLVLEVPIGTRWRCSCCGRLVVVTEDHPDPVCPAGTRAPWLPSHNPFTPSERWTARSPIDSPIPH